MASTPSAESKKRTAGSAEEEGTPKKARMRSAKKIPFHKLVGTEMVNLYVGKGTKRTHFHIHRAILCRKIPYFEKMFGGGFKEGIWKTGEFPEDSPDAFDVLLEWVYTDVLRPFQWLKSESGNDANYTVHKLYNLLDKFCVPSLPDILYPTLANMHAGLPADSKFRQYPVLCAHHLISGASRSEKHLSLWSTEGLWSEISSNPELGLDYFKLMREHPIGNAAEDPRDMDHCRFHQHGPEEDCPAKKQTE